MTKIKPHCRIKQHCKIEWNRNHTNKQNNMNEYYIFHIITYNYYGTNEYGESDAF
jgi:hypothetical protein